MVEIAFGEWLHRERKRLRLTQAQLAEQVGCSTVALRKIEAEERRPSAQILDRLAAVFAVPPSDRTAFQRFARGDWQAAPASILTGVAWHVERVSPSSHLPAPLTSFIGREQDVAKVREYLSDAEIRLVTLIGPPGIGKTRLSLQVASEARADFADGVFFVPLAPIDDPDRVAPAMIQALGLVQTDQRSLLERLEGGINDRQLLIVLDNFEQIIDGAAPLIPELLVACPRLKLLVTSRESLRVSGEWLYLVPPLLTPDEHQVKNLEDEAIDRYSALRLFAERARAVRPEFALTPENTLTVAAICRRLDGLPLAIELIAARLRLMSPQALLLHLTSAFTLHADGTRGMPDRQKTLHNAIAWSYDLLNRDEQVLLARLSVFVAGFTLDAAQAVTQMPNAIAGLISLLDKSLLVRTIDVKGETRFSLLVMIHDFAQARLREMNEEAALRHRHAAYFLALAEEANQAVSGPQETVWLSSLELVHGDLLASLTWLLDCEGADCEAGLRLAGSLGNFWYIRGYWTEGLYWLDRALAKTGDNFRSLRARLLLAIGPIFLRRGQIEQAVSYLQNGLGLCEELGDKRGMARALEWLGAAAELRDGLDQGIALFQQSLALCRKLDDKPGMASLLARLGYIAQKQGDIDRGAHLIEESLRLSDAAGDKSSSAFSLRYLGWTALAKSNLAQAAMLFQRSLKFARELDERSAIGGALIGLGELARMHGDYEEAAKFYEESMLMFQELGVTSAIRALIHNLGYVALHQANNGQARMLFEQALIQNREAQDKEGIAQCLRGLAAVASMNGEFESAARLFGIAEVLLETVERLPNIVDEAEYQRFSLEALNQLNTAKYASLLAEGRALPLEQAIELILSYKTE